MNLQEINEHFQHILSTQESKRMDLETANRIDVSQREMKLAEENPPNDNISVSPNG